MSRVSRRPERAELDRLLSVAAVAVTVTLWASAFVVIRYADRELSPGALALGRLLVGALTLGVVVLARRGSVRFATPPGRALAGIALCGVLWFGAYSVSLNQAEKRVDAGTAAMLVNIGPILIAILAGWILREGSPRRLLLGCLVSFAGAVLIGIATSRHGIDGLWGAGLCIAAAIAYACGVVAQKPTLRHTSALYVTWLACTIGAVSCLGYAPSLVHGLAHARAATIWWTVYLGAAPTAIGFALWAYALARTTAGRMGTTTYLVPPLAVALGWAVLGEVPPALALPGGALCLAGVAIARSRSRSRSRSGAAGSRSGAAVSRA